LGYGKLDELHVVGGVPGGKSSRYSGISQLSNTECDYGLATRFDGLGTPVNSSRRCSGTKPAAAHGTTEVNLLWLRQIAM